MVAANLSILSAADEPNEQFTVVNPLTVGEPSAEIITSVDGIAAESVQVNLPTLPT
jgi:hypothetical protein